MRYLRNGLFKYIQVILYFTSIRIHVWLQQPSPIYDMATRDRKNFDFFLVFVERDNSSCSSGFIFKNGYPSL